MKIDNDEVIKATINGKDVLDPNYPLMIKLRELCPGTYSHAKNVADLLEAMSTELGLDSRKLKIAGFYHDIGKTRCPLAFSENQPDDVNIHDALEPWLSYQLISGHVAHTIQILYDDPHIDPDVVEWCSQHHGTTLVGIFFRKSGCQNESEYRYKTQSPKSIEAALLMLCDHLEARLRSERKSGRIQSRDQVDDLVETVFEQLIDDDQVDDVIVKLKTLRQMKKILKRELANKFDEHKRIDYKEKEEAS
jgi:putative nucleotidyltransferase with HDIG domain